MGEHFMVNPVTINLAKCIYYAHVECVGTTGESFDSLVPRERARFIEIAARTLIELNPPRARVRIEAPIKSTPKPPIFEVWELSSTLSSSRFITDTRTLSIAIDSLSWRRPLRVRTFYDRHRKRRIVQFLCGNGIAVHP